MRLTKMIVSAAALLAASTLGAAAQDFTLSPDIAARIAAGETPNFVVSYHDPAVPFAAPIRQGVEEAAAALGVNAEFVGPVGGGAERQVAELEGVIARGVDGLAVSSASTDALAPLINRALEQGIPVVAFNTDNPSSNRLTFIGQDLVKSGETVGEQLVKYMGEQGIILIVTVDAAAQWSQDRESGARTTLANYPGIEIRGVINTTAEPQQAYAAIENAMLANSDVTGIVSLDCCSFPAAAQYVERNGLTGQVTVVGFDLLEQTLQFIKDGVAQSTISQNPYQQGYDSVRVLTELVKDGTLPADRVDTGAEIVDSTNIDQYLTE